MKAIKKLLKKKPTKWVLTIVAALVVGYIISLSLLPKPVVGIVSIKGSITPSSAEPLLSELREAREDSGIKAVLLEINSPGGEAASIEELYLEILRLRKEKPVFASVDNLAASGAYYIAVAANSIYAKPSSTVGGVGAFAIFPEPEKVAENVVTTGPFKEIGAPRKRYAEEVQLIIESFLRAVLTQRPAINLTKDELAKAQLYTGIEAIQLGLIDRIGTTGEAIEAAADMAGLRSYTVKRLGNEFPGLLASLLSVNESLLTPTNTVPLTYYLYLSAKK